MIHGRVQGAQMLVESGLGVPRRIVTAGMSASCWCSAWANGTP